MTSRALPALPEIAINEILRLMGFTRMIAAPIIMENKPVGILCVIDDNLLEKDTAAISFFAQQLSSALEKATLLERARAEVLQRTHAELALQQSEARLQSLINAIPEPTFLIGTETRSSPPISPSWPSPTTLRSKSSIARLMSFSRASC